MNTNEIFIKYNLPEPLSEEELQNLIKEAKEGSKEARNQWIIYSIKIVKYEVTTRFQNVDYDKKELVSIGIIGLIKAIDTYDMSKGIKFLTYAIKCIDNEILMFLKKLKRNRKVDSIDKVVVHDKNDHKLKLEDILSNDTDLVKENETAETHKIIREVVKNLPVRDREIIMLYFGFYNNQIYTQKQIAGKLNIAQSYVSTLIPKIVERIGKILESKGVIELHSSRKENEEEMRNLQTIYEYFKNYTKEQVDEMLTKLTDEEKLLVTLRYGEDLNNPISTKLSKKQTSKFYGSVIPKMKRLLSNLAVERKPSQRKEKDEQPEQPEQPEQVEGELIPKSAESQEQSIESTPSNNEEMTKEDCIKILELLKTPSFNQMMNSLSIKEAVIISLKLGYIDGKYFSTESISEFLGIDPLEVTETTKKILLVYKDNINSFLDNAIAIATDEVGKGRRLKEPPSQ